MARACGPVIGYAHSAQTTTTQTRLFATAAACRRLQASRVSQILLRSVVRAAPGLWAAVGAAQGQAIGRAPAAATTITRAGRIATGAEFQRRPLTRAPACGLAIGFAPPARTTTTPVRPRVRSAKRLGPPTPSIRGTCDKPTGFAQHATTTTMRTSWRATSARFRRSRTRSRRRELVAHGGSSSRRAAAQARFHAHLCARAHARLGVQARKNTHACTRVRVDTRTHARMRVAHRGAAYVLGLLAKNGGHA